MQEELTWREALDLACKAICIGCEEGMELRPSRHPGFEWWHWGGDEHNGARFPCKAHKIIELIRKIET